MWKQNKNGERIFSSLQLMDIDFNGHCYDLAYDNKMHGFQTDFVCGKNSVKKNLSNGRWRFLCEKKEREIIGPKMESNFR